MSDDNWIWIIGWLILLLIANAVYRYIKYKRNEKVEAEQLRALLKLKIESFKQVATALAAKETYFQRAVEDDAAHGYPTEEIEVNRKRAIEAERDGRGLCTAAAALEEVIKQQTKEQMISVMERYVLDFGRNAAEQRQRKRRAADDKQQQEQIETDGIVNTVVETALNGILAEIRSGVEPALAGAVNEAGQAMLRANDLKSRLAAGLPIDQEYEEAVERAKTGPLLNAPLPPPGQPYGPRRERMIGYAWKKWTHNGLGLDAKRFAKSKRTVQDAVDITFVDGISDGDWLAATMKRLGPPPEAA
ncbi:MAG: hypothetical protein ACLPKH_06720 [Rhodomicrobium sp.]